MEWALRMGKIESDVEVSERSWIGTMNSFTALVVCEYSYERVKFKLIS
jgi:hypothetical protein